MIITVKDKETVYVATSVESTFSGMHTDDIIEEDNLKMWRPLGKDDCIMAISACGDVGIDQLRYANFEVLDKPLSTDMMTREVTPAIRELYNQQDLLDDGHLWHTILVAKGDKAFTISPNFTVCEVEKFEAVGFSDTVDMAFGVLSANEDLSPIERITETFRVLEQGTLSKHFPIVVRNTKTAERTVIY